MVIKQQVNFAKCAILGLRKAEPTPDVTKKVRTSVEEAGFGTPVPGYKRSARQLGPHLAHSFNINGAGGLTLS